jgi:hypothetical protein
MRVFTEAGKKLYAQLMKIMRPVSSYRVAFLAASELQAKVSWGEGKN